VNPISIFENHRAKALPVLLLITGLLLAMSAQSASAGSGGMGPGGTTAGTTTAGPGKTPSKYHRLWNRVPGKEKRWANDVAECETGKDPDLTALGGEYRGAFMFLQETWDNAPKSPGGDPIDYSYKTQAVVAVALKKQLGTDPWPACG
jgi:hypothetical protein